MMDDCIMPSVACHSRINGLRARIIRQDRPASAVSARVPAFRFTELLTGHMHASHRTGRE